MLPLPFLSIVLLTPPSPGIIGRDLKGLGTESFFLKNTPRKKQKKAAKQGIHLKKDASYPVFLPLPNSPRAPAGCLPLLPCLPPGVTYRIVLLLWLWCWCWYFV
ncbi:hypothetical protein T492DRAFT_1008361 [Pavlovales sp. CCMP2436]|nr:hypothetical protein T492DRAFT_1008361 [Pavlovales sp. CCMP2436]